MKIAICDDDRQELTHIVSLLERYQQTNIEKLSIHPFSSSFELAVSARAERYDLYLLDIIMPGLDGMELAREIRSFDRAADLIFLTTSPEFAVESYTVKATNYLMKPVSEKQLSAALDDICQAREKEQGSTILLKSTIGFMPI